MANIRYFTADQQLSAVRHDGSIYTSAKHFKGSPDESRQKGRPFNIVRLDEVPSVLSLPGL